MLQLREKMLAIERKNLVYIAHGFIQTDTLCFHLPEGYFFSAISQEATVGNMFGEYKTFIKSLQQVADYDPAIFMISHS